MDPLPCSRDLVLIGGGHTHALLLRAWGMAPLAGARVTLVNPGPTAPYTGMLPGFVAGHYGRDDLDIDLVRLARFAGARMIFGTATGIDRAARTVRIDDVHLGQREIGYDVLSLDIGVHSEMPDLPGFTDHAVPAKPLGRLAERWGAWRGDGPVAVIGGGVAGAELAMAAAHGRPGTTANVIEAGRALAGLSQKGGAALRRALRDRGVALIEEARVARIDAEAVHLEDGRRIPARFVIGAAGGRPHGWLSGVGLDLKDGYVRVGPTLASSDPAIFATGDCAHMAHAPRPKAGVFAVRQAPILARNLRAALGAGTPARYDPQAGYLKLISLGERAALADRGRFAIEGRWLWRLKDRIDARFMARLRDLPAMRHPALPAARAAGLEALTAQEPCGGCAAKVGRAALNAVLGGGDDAALGADGSLLTVDQIRAVCPDPALHARIAARHALGDIRAMGGRATEALALVTLPRLAPALEERTLREVRAALDGAMGDVPIVGGHTATGPDAMIGLAVRGHAATPIGIAGARPGDALVLTKPLGTGILLAAEMQMRARGADMAAAYAQMAGDDGDAAERLSVARAMTDVTGFGLAGHLWGMLVASDVAARIDAGALPLLPGVRDLMAGGIRSTLHDRNRAGIALGGAEDPRAEILFDPQTAGGLLAALPPAEAAAAAADLGAAMIGQIEAGPPVIRIV